MSENLKTTKVYARALDPIHIGAGGYRLGRVDNTIVRDPATDVPKIPGSSIAGVMKAYYELHPTEKGNNGKNKDEKEEKSKEDKKDTNFIFGTQEQKGKLRFYDGQIIFFPVSSIQGTIWITTKELLEYWFGEIKDERGEGIKIPEKTDDKAYLLKGIDPNNPLNLGWLLLEVEKIGNEKEVVLPSKINRWVKRIVVVSDKLFSHIINDNLEVRTSVKIDSETGTAEQGKLFTYEAMPRGTILGFEIGVDNYGDTASDTNVNKVITAVSPYLKYLGIGGMGTRGFGRIELFWEQKSEKKGGGNDA